MTKARLKRRWQPLAIVPTPAYEPVPEISFCSSCGTPPTPGSDSRVCGACQLGLMLTAAADVAPGPGSAFVVIDSSLSVCAVSAAAEKLLATNETDAVFPHEYRFAEGMLHPGEQPGLGVDIDETLAAQYPYKRAYLPVNRLEDGSMHDW